MANIKKLEVKLEKAVLKKNMAVAKQIAEEILISNPNHINALNVIAAVSFMEKNYDGCINVSKHVLSVDGNNGVALHAVEVCSAISQKSTLNSYGF